MSTVDLANIKTQVKSILDTANDAGADYDLSTGMDNRVKAVMTIHPQLVPVQSSLFPCVSMFYDAKDIQPGGIAKNQLTAKKVGTVSLNLVGMVFLHHIPDPLKDKSDTECEQLMENVERVLRANDDLNGSVLNQLSQNVTYHNLQIEEEVFLRTGILTVECKVYY